MQHPDIARLVDEIADLLEIQSANPFRVRAYRTAARTVRDFSERLSDVVRERTRALTELPGIGEDLAGKIRTIMTTGSLPLHRQLVRKVPLGRLRAALKRGKRTWNPTRSPRSRALKMTA